MQHYIECKVRYQKMMEDGSEKMVNEPYLVDAMSFTEAEKRITETKIMDVFKYEPKTKEDEDGNKEA